MSRSVLALGDALQRAQNQRCGPRQLDRGQRANRAVLRCRFLHSLLVLTLAAPTAAMAQQGVTGRVTAGDDGRPLGSVNVVVKGTDAGVLTGNDGRYSLDATGAGDTLVFDLIGFRRLEVAIAGRSVVDVVLETEALQLDELVAVGYGTQQRRDVTGSVTTVEADRLTAVATPSVAQALQGKAAGVQVTPTSGEPGEGAVVRIRGVGTLNDASPLFVVDGMLLDDISFLSSADIESIEVLKDASATAIYGSRGANGVIIITTRAGAPDQPTQFRARAYVGSQRVLDPIDLVSAEEYAILANELAANTGVPEYFPDSGSVGPGTNWQDQIFEPATIQNYQVTASGGTERVRYFFGIDYMEQAGVIAKSDYTRVTLRANNEYSLTDRVTIGHNLSFTHKDDDRAPSVLRALYYADPTVSPRNEGGDFSDASLRSSAGNPAATVFYTRNNGGEDRLVGMLNGEARFPGGFTFRSRFGLDYEQEKLRTFTPEFIVSPTQQNTESSLEVRNDFRDRKSVV